MILFSDVSTVYYITERTQEGVQMALNDKSYLLKEKNHNNVNVLARDVRSV